MIVAFLHDTQERMTKLASHPGDDATARHWVEVSAARYLQQNEPDSESFVVVAQIIERTEAADFVMRGPTPA